MEEIEILSMPVLPRILLIVLVLGVLAVVCRRGVMVVRPMVCVVLIGLGVLLFGYRTRAVPVRAADARVRYTAAPAQITASARQDPGSSAAAWTIEGTYAETREEAERDALAKARTSVEEYLRSLEPPVFWTPSQEYVNARLVKKRQEEPLDAPDLGVVMRRVRLELEITPKDRADILQRDHRYQVEQRMLWLGKVMTILVALLAAVSGYVRLDEQTKGYYSGWLRLGAVGFVAAVGLALFLFVIA